MTIRRGAAEYTLRDRLCDETVDMEQGTGDISYGMNAAQSTEYRLFGMGNGNRHWMVIRDVA